MGRKSSELTNEMRNLVINLHKDGKSLREIGKTVERSFTIQSIIKIYKNSGRINKKIINQYHFWERVIFSD